MTRIRTIVPNAAPQSYPQLLWITGEVPAGIVKHALSGFGRPPILRALFPYDCPRTAAMKSGIHPDYKAITVTCSCGNAFQTCSTLGEDLQIEVCSNCHPFYTGKQKIVDTGGRVDRFRKKYARG